MAAAAQRLPDLRRGALLSVLGQPTTIVVAGRSARALRRGGAVARRSVAALRRAYPGEGHDVQYRHWDQILLDAAGLGDATRAASGTTRRRWEA